MRWVASDNGLHVSVRLPEWTDAVVSVPTLAGASSPPDFVPGRVEGYVTGNVRGTWAFSSNNNAQCRSQQP